MKEKQFDYQINVGFAKNNNISNIHIKEGDKIIFENDTKTDNIRIYQYNTRIFVGLITQEEFEESIKY